MWQFFEDYFGSRTKSRCSGVLFAYRGRIQEGKDEVKRLARKSRVDLTLRDKDVYGRDVNIYWECEGTNESIKMFHDLLTVSESFRMIRLDTPDEGGEGARA